MVPVSLVFWKLKPTQPQGRGGGYIGKDHRAGVVSVKSERVEETMNHPSRSLPRALLHPTLSWHWYLIWNGPRQFCGAGEI